MSIPSTPSPHLGETWSAEANGTEQGGSSGGSSPAVGYAHANGRSKTVTWSAAAAAVSGAGANGRVSYPANQPGFLGRHYRRFSGSLPRFRSWGNGRDFAQKEKLGRGRWLSADGNMRRNLTSIGARILRRMRLRFVVVLAFLLAVFLFYVTREWDRWQGFQAEVALTVGRSSASALSGQRISRRREPIRHPGGSEPRRRCDGVERASRMGHREGQHQEQEGIRREVGLSPRDCGYEHQETVRTRMARELGEGGRPSKRHEELPPR